MMLEAIIKISKRSLMNLIQANYNNQIMSNSIDVLIVASTYNVASY